MDNASISAIAEVLNASGPFGIVAILGWAYWRLNEKKDRELKTIYERMVVLSEQQTAAITKVEAALVALKEAIAGIRRG